MKRIFLFALLAALLAGTAAAGTLQLTGKSYTRTVTCENITLTDILFGAESWTNDDLDTQTFLGALDCFINHGRVKTLEKPAEEPVDCSKYNATFKGVTPLGGGLYNWSYQVCQAQKYAISHWVIEMCNPGTIDSFGSSLPGATLTYGYDGSSGVTGLKFDSLTWDNDTCEYFWFVINTGATQTDDYLIKPANEFCHYTGLEAPSCSATSTTTTQATTSTTESTTTTSTTQETTTTTESTTSTTESTTTTTQGTTTTTCPTTTTTVPNAPEIGSAIAAIALASPAFAYLIIRKKR